MIKKILNVAGREFAATVLTKGFIIGMLITPSIIAGFVFLMPRLMNRAAPKVVGTIAIVDPTGQIAEGLRDFLQPKKYVERREAMRGQVLDATPTPLRQAANSSPQGKVALQKSLDVALNEVPQLTVVKLESSSDLEEAKAPLKKALPESNGSKPGQLALVVVHPNAIKRGENQDAFGSYDIFVRSKLDDRIEGDIRDGLRESIVDARIRTSGLDRKEIDSMTKVARTPSRTVTAEGERTTNEALNILLPAAFMILLLLSVMTSGQYLLTTTVEEKSNRIVEVLLSAVSSMELMVGKILGQMGVGLLVLALYASLGIVALISFAMLGLLDPILIVFLLIFFLLAFFTIASFMAAIGSAVNEMREAQTLMMPVMLLIMIPWILWLPISRDPNSALATTLSFIPPVSNFVMLLRMSSTAPPPLWQIGLSILVSASGACLAVWFAAKVFRIGLLMFGKPPTIGTLIRWARMS